MFSRSARRIGLTSRVVRQPLDKLRDALLPAVLLLDGEEACILRAIDPESGMARVSFSELTESEVSISLEELAGKYLGLAILSAPASILNAARRSWVKSARATGSGKPFTAACRCIATP
jgi:ATP-binding cassette subfamily C protein LapB